MNKCHTPLNWQNDTTPAINDTNLNYMDGCIDTNDDRIVAMDTTKANQSDLLQSVKNVTYNTTTGVITITWWNGNTYTIDLNIEKIPVSFTMSEAGVITMTTADGTEYTADISTVIKLYNFVDSDEIDFTVVQNGNNYTVTASIVEGSITADKLQPNFLADCQAAANTASTAATASNTNKLASEGWANGTAEGEAITDPTSPYYHNNAKWWKEQAEAVASQSLAGLTDVNIDTPQNGQALVYDEENEVWVNAEVEAAAELSELTDVDITTPGEGQALVYDADSGKWINKDIQSGATAVINVSTEDATLIGETVTLTLDGVEVATSVFGADKTCQFVVNETGLYLVEVGEYSSQANVTAMYQTYSVIITTMVTITITLEGAKEDNITVKQNGVTVATCVFGSGQTSGTVSLDVPKNGTSISFVFESSVAKDTTTGTSNYQKTVSINKTTAIVKVMTDGALYWHSNECADLTGGLNADGFSWTQSSEFNPTSICTVTKNTSNLSISCPTIRTSAGVTYNLGWLPFQNKIDLTQYTYIHAMVKRTTQIGNGQVSISTDKSKLGESTMGITVNLNTTSADSDFVHVISDSISSLDGQYYIWFRMMAQSYVQTMIIDSVWLE